MSHYDSYNPGGKPPVADLDGSHNSFADFGKPRCPLESYVVPGAAASRMVVIFLRDFLENGLLYSTTESEFPCAMPRCNAKFTAPMAYITHLVSCPYVIENEFECSKCKKGHRFPRSEKEWEAFSGWMDPAPPRPGQKHPGSLSFSTKMKILGHRLVTPRRSGSTSSNASSSNSVSSPSSFLPSPSAYTCELSGAGLEPRDFSSYQAPSSSPVDQATKKGARHFRVAPRQSLAELPQDSITELVGDHRACLELPGSTKGHLVDSWPVKTSHDHHARHVPAAQNSQQLAIGIPSPWSSFSSEASSSQSVMSSMPQDRHAVPNSRNYLVSPPSSIDSIGSGLQQPSGQTSQFFNGPMMESPTETDEIQATRSWIPPMSSHTNSVDSCWSDQAAPQQAFQQQLPFQDVQMPAYVQAAPSMLPAQSRRSGHDSNAILAPLHTDSQHRQLLMEALNRHRLFVASLDNSNLGLHHQFGDVQESVHPQDFFDLSDQGPFELESTTEWSPGDDLCFGDLRATNPDVAAEASSSATATRRPADSPFKASHRDPALNETAAAADDSIEDLKCAVCDFRPTGADPRSYRGYLRKHEETHGEKKFICNFQGCGKAIGRKDNYMTHRRKIHGILPDGSICKDDGGTGGGGDEASPNPRFSRGRRARPRLPLTDGPAAGLTSFQALDPLGSLRRTRVGGISKVPAGSLANDRRKRGHERSHWPPTS